MLQLSKYKKEDSNKLMKNIIKEIWRAICYPLIYIVIQILVSVAFFIITDFEPEISSLNLLIILLVSAALSFVCIWLLLRREWKQESFWKVQGFSFGTFLLCAVASVPISLFIGGMIQLTGLTQIFPNPVETIVGKNLLFEIAVVAVLVPIVEEVIFRGTILRRFLENSMNITLAVCLQALMFAIIHLNVLQGIYTFLIGLVFGLVYVWFKSIWLPVIMHITYNLFSVLMSNLPNSGESSASSAVSYGAVAVMTLIMFAVSALLLWLIFRKRIKKIKT